jgi:hypothetical protein
MRYKVYIVDDYADERGKMYNAICQIREGIRNSERGMLDAFAECGINTSGVEILEPTLIPPGDTGCYKQQDVDNFISALRTQPSSGTKNVLLIDLFLDQAKMSPIFFSFAERFNELCCGDFSNIIPCTGVPRALDPSRNDSELFLRLKARGIQKNFRDAIYVRRKTKDNAYVYVDLIERILEAQ